MENLEYNHVFKQIAWLDLLDVCTLEVGQGALACADPSRPETCRRVLSPDSHPPPPSPAPPTGTAAGPGPPGEEETGNTDKAAP